MSLIIKDLLKPRLSADELAAWRALPVATISDELNRGQTMVAAIKPLSPGMEFAGEALTVQSMVGDNVTLHYAVGYAWPGCVIVADGRGHVDTAVWGGVLTHAAMVRGVSAVVVDGATRDAAEIRASGLSVFSRAIVPNGPHKGYGGTIGGEIQCAGVVVGAGDLVIGDDDGVVVIRPDQMAGLMERCAARVAKEASILEGLSAGIPSHKLQGLPPPDEIG